MGRRSACLLWPFFGDRPIAQITPDDVERFMAAEHAEGRSAKSVRHYLGVLHSLAHAEKRDWAASNVCRKVDFPRIEELDADIRFLTAEGMEALLRAVDRSHERARRNTRRPADASGGSA
jgi:site-specific recombinase XerD